MADRLGSKNNGKSDINELRTYFKSLNTPQKKEFIHKLQQKLNSVKTVKYDDFLSECIQTYNQEVKAHNNNNNNNNNKDATKPPDISADSFAIAFASLFATAKSSPTALTIGAQLTGTWQRESNGKIFYYNFNDDGTFETNTVMNHEIIKGHYSIGIENAVLMEPHDLLQINSLMLSVSGSSLTIGLTNGTSYEYRRER